MPPPLRTRCLAAVVATIVVIVIIAVTSVAMPYARAALFVVRATNTGGRIEAIANAWGHRVTVKPRHWVPTRYGNIEAQFYEPSGRARRSVLLLPGIHSLGIAEPRLTALAKDLAGTGVRVMTLALPDLMHYQITPRSTDVIEDAVQWMAARTDLAPDGRVGVIGISFAGGLSIVAAGRPSVRDKVAFVLSFGGHGDLPRVMRYLSTGQAPQVPGVQTRPPHDYGVAVTLYALAGRVVPAEQVGPLRDGISTFLLASQLTHVNISQSNAMFKKAREMAKNLAEPSATYLTYVNDRNVRTLGPILAPHMTAASRNAAMSPERAPTPPAAPVFLLHGRSDAVIPAAESVVLGDYLRHRGVDTHVLLSGLITHAEVNRSAAASETWNLVVFWTDVLRQ